MHYEEKEMDGKMWYRTAPGGAWTMLDAPIDKLIQMVRDKLELKSLKAAKLVLGFESSAISRIRSGKGNISARMVLCFHEILDIPVKDIYKIGRIKPFTSRPGGEIGHTQQT